MGGAVLEPMLGTTFSPATRTPCSLQASCETCVMRMPLCTHNSHLSIFVELDARAGNLLPRLRCLETAPFHHVLILRLSLGH